MKKKVLVEEGRNSWSRMPPLPPLLLLLALVVGSPLRDDNSAAERSTMTMNHHHRTIKTTTVGDCTRGRRIRTKESRSDDDASPPRGCCGCFCCFRELGIVPSVCIVRGVVIGKECSCCCCAEDATMKRRDEYASRVIIDDRMLSFLGE